MRRAPLLAVVLLALGASGAEGHTTIIEPSDSHYPYQQWVDEARVPTPDVTLAVVENDSGCAGQGIACTALGTGTIWFQPFPTWRPVRRIFYHELGHNFDYYSLGPQARDRFRYLLHDPRDWTADPNGPNESFAAAYSSCAITGPHFVGDPNLFIKGNGAAIQQRTYRRICRLIGSASQEWRPTVSVP